MNKRRLTHNSKMNKRLPKLWKNPYKPYIRIYESGAEWADTEIPFWLTGSESKVWLFVMTISRMKSCKRILLRYRRQPAVINRSSLMLHSACSAERSKRVVRSQQLVLTRLLLISGVSCRSSRLILRSDAATYNRSPAMPRAFAKSLSPLLRYPVWNKSVLYAAAVRNSLVKQRKIHIKQRVVGKGEN